MWVLLVGGFVNAFSREGLSLGLLRCHVRGFRGVTLPFFGSSCTSRNIPTYAYLGDPEIADFWVVCGLGFSLEGFLRVLVAFGLLRYFLFFGGSFFDRHFPGSSKKGFGNITQWLVQISLLWIWSVWISAFMFWQFEVFAYLL